ncbi:hypothetical protein [Hymenobacter sp. DG25B]|nr:hypothetical protein [Hymenobacter sp. DG25B]
MTIQFIHRTENMDALGRSVVYLLAHFNQKRLRISTGEQTEATGG